RYGFILIESEGAITDHISVLLDNGTKLKTLPINDVDRKLFDLMKKFSNVDGTLRRTIVPLPYAPLTVFQAIQTLDHATMMIEFLDHLCFWSCDDYDTIRTWDKTSRYKIREGTSALAQAILDDCQDVNLLLSPPVVSIHGTDDKKVIIHT
ncbi:unnamed protein product, partial [Rotaria sp. Silwood2]